MSVLKEAAVFRKVIEVVLKVKAEVRKKQ